MINLQFHHVNTSKGKFTIINERRDKFCLRPWLLWVESVSELVESNFIQSVQFVNVVLKNISVKVSNEVLDGVRDLDSDGLLLGRNNAYKENYVLLLVWCPKTKKVFHDIVFLNLYLLNRNRHQHQHPEDIEPKWRVQLRQQDRLPRSYRGTWSTRIMNQPPEEVLAILPCRLQIILNTV